MKIKSVTLKNFRAYKEATTISFEDLTTFVGKNDIGKSSVLEALDIFFNDGAGVVKLDKYDTNHDNSEQPITITVEFTELPEKIVIDAQNETTLKDEYLLTIDSTLKICKEYFGTGKAKVYIIANHPCNTLCKELLKFKIDDLKKMLEKYKIECSDKTRSSVIRQAIWKHFHDDLDLKETTIDTSKEGAKDIFVSLEQFLPLYSLFKADRSNDDTDSEVQDPMKIAVKQIMQEQNVVDLCNKISIQVREQLEKVASGTIEKLKEMSASTASSLTPNISTAENIKWADVFKSVSINSDNEIPLNKRGSGVRRMVLISFFRAEVQRKINNQDSLRKGVIYAIEEPETSQHAEMQQILMNSLKTLASRDNVQVILTTHSSIIVKQLKYDEIRVIKEEDGIRKVGKPKSNTLPYSSLNEINYTSFFDSSEEYHNELYGWIQECAINEKSECSKEQKFDSWLKEKGFNNNEDKKWKRVVSGRVQEAQPVTLQTYIRNTIHHPENRENDAYTHEELKKSIEEMRNFIIQKKIMNR